MTETTTRRVSVAELRKLKEIQLYLEKNGIKLSQAETSELITGFVINHFDDFLTTLRAKQKRKKRDPLNEWLSSVFEGGEETDAVMEHDVII